MATEDHLDHNREITIVEQVLADTQSKEVSAEWLLVIWDLVLGIPFSALLVWINKVVLRAARMEDFLRSQRGLVMNKVIFVVCNIALIVMWTMQLGLRKKTSTEQLKVLVKVSEDEVKQLEDVKEAIRIEEELTPKINKYKDMFARASKVPRVSTAVLDEDIPFGFDAQELEEQRRRSGGVPPETPKDVVDAGFEKAIGAQEE